MPLSSKYYKVAKAEENLALDLLQVENGRLSSYTSEIENLTTEYVVQSSSESRIDKDRDNLTHQSLVHEDTLLNYKNNLHGNPESFRSDLYFENSNSTFDISKRESDNEISGSEVVVPNLTIDSLKLWSVKHHIKHSALNDLLKLIGSKNSEFPRDARTLLKTPRKIDTIFIRPGHYYHFGLEKAVLCLLEKYPHYDKLNQVEIYVNIDGLPLSKSSSSQLYPILCSLTLNREVVSIIGIYQGLEKPKSANEFLSYFVSDAIVLLEKGLYFKNHFYSFKIKGFICDVPAKSFILYTKGHSGYYSCFKCETEGDYLKGRVCFHDLNFALRTDRRFRAKAQYEHHTGTSLLEDIDVNLIEAFPSDPMHLIYLGVAKKLITLWCTGKPPHRLSCNQIKVISERLIALKRDIPCEINRKPRSVIEYKRWKATEFRVFILYTGIIVLRSVVNRNMYLNFVCLHISITILSNPKVCVNYADYAKSLIKYFVETFGKLYGTEHISHNVHSLLHLTDAKNFGTLDQFSAFPFENFMQSLLRLIRKNEKPLEQIIFRTMEADSLSKVDGKKKPNHFPVLLKCYFSDSAGSEHHFEIAEFENFILNIKVGPDNCCCLKDGSVIIIKNIIIKNNLKYILGAQFNIVNDFYSLPCLSSILGIHLVDIKDLNPPQLFSISNIDMKCIKFHFENDKYVIIPLIHTIKHGMSWSIVEFLESHTVEAVPSSWILGNQCYWPPLTREKIIMEIKKREVPNTCWPLFRIRTFKDGTYDNYLLARNKARKAENTSDLNSEAEENRKIGKEEKFPIEYLHIPLIRKMWICQNHLP